jgi:hypothetical protein
MESRKSLKSLVPKILLLVLFVFIVFYAHSRTAFLSQGVQLSVDNLENGETIGERVIELTGTAKRAIRLTLNGRELLIDEKGDFSDTLVLSPGFNTLTIEAEDKFDNYKQLDYMLWQNDHTTNTQSIIDRYRNDPSPPPTEEEQPIDEVLSETEEIETEEEIIN